MAWHKRIFGREPKLDRIPILNLERGKTYERKILDSEPEPFLTRFGQRARIRVQYQSDIYFLVFGEGLIARTLHDISSKRGNLKDVRLSITRPEAGSEDRKYKVEVVE